MNWIELVKKHWPNISNEGANDILWNATCFPMGSAELVEEQIKEGLSKLDFTNMIKTSLVYGPTDRETSFKIGNKLKVRFVMYFEPAYGKEKENFRIF